MLELFGVLGVTLVGVGVLLWVVWRVSLVDRERLKWLERVGKDYSEKNLNPFDW